MTKLLKYFSIAVAFVGVFQEAVASGHAELRPSYKGKKYRVTIDEI